MSYPDPDELTPITTKQKCWFWVAASCIVGVIVIGIISRDADLTEAQRVERCAAHQGALPEVGGIFYRRLDGLKVQVLSTRFPWDPTAYDSRNNIDSKFCAYVIQVRVEGHAERSGMKLFEFVRPEYNITPTALTIQEGG